MALFTVTINPINNLPPNQVGDNIKSIENGAIYTFSLFDFTLGTTPQYNDPEGDPLGKIQITGSTPLEGSLELNGTPVSLGDEITKADLNSGNFIYVSSSTNTGLYSISFSFFVADEGSNTYYLGESGLFTINVASAENLPPAEVGDGEATIEYASTLTFTRAMFTTQTTPPYNDPEGDAALNLRVDSLPTVGLLKLNGLNVFANQIISFDDIDNGNLTYVSDLADTDGDLQEFTFSIADAGSGQFVS